MMKDPLLLPLPMAPELSLQSVAVKAGQCLSILGDGTGEAAEALLQWSSGRRKGLSAPGDVNVRSLSSVSLPWYAAALSLVRLHLNHPALTTEGCLTMAGWSRKPSLRVFSMSPAEKRQLQTAMLLAMNPQGVVLQDATLVPLFKEAGIPVICLSDAKEHTDVIAIVRTGTVIRTGDRDSVRQHPGSLYTTKLLGQVNLVKGVLAARSKERKVAVEVGGLTLEARCSGSLPKLGETVYVSVPVQSILLYAEAQPGFHVSATVTQLRGKLLTVSLPDGQVLTCHNPLPEVTLGQRVFLTWAESACDVLAAQDE